MSELFEDDEGLIEPEELLTDLAVETEPVEVVDSDMDARRRLESLLEERRLREELDDFVDY